MTTVSSLGQNALIRYETRRLQEQINKLQQQITSGYKTDRYGDLGALAPLSISLHNQGERVTSYKEVINFLEIRTGMMDQSLNGIRSTALDIRDLTIRSLGFDAGRQEILRASQNAIGQITQKLQVNVDGRYLFAGTKSDAAPMADNAALLADVRAAINTALTATPAPTDIPAAIETAVAGVFATTSNYYTGGAKHAATQIDDNLSVDTSITGNDPAFEMVLRGLYTMAALDMPVDPPTAPQISSADFDATVQRAASLMYAGIAGVENLITMNGSNQSTIENTSVSHELTMTLVQGQINDILNVDPVEASTRITQLRTQLEASFQLTAQLRELSLINFLR